MKRIIRIFLTCFTVILLASPVFAHDFWLVPRKFKINPGETLTILANTGMDFPNSLSAVTPDRVSQFILIGEPGKEHITDYEVQGKSLVAALTLIEPGTYVLAVSLKPKEISLKAKDFNEYLLHDGLTNVYELRKERGILDQDAVEYYSKYPKTIIQVGSKSDETPTKPLGLPIEIVPFVNPYRLSRGDNLKIRVLFRGNPLPEAEVAWSYPGRGEEFAGITKTDKEGQATIPLEKIGPYVIRLTHMEWVKKPTHEWESYWTSLTFKVLPER